MAKSRTYLPYRVDRTFWKNQSSWIPHISGSGAGRDVGIWNKLFIQPRTNTAQFELKSLLLASECRSGGALLFFFLEVLSKHATFPFPFAQELVHVSLFSPLWISHPCAIAAHTREWILCCVKDPTATFYRKNFMQCVYTKIRIFVSNWCWFDFSAGWIISPLPLPPSSIV